MWHLLFKAQINSGETSCDDELNHRSHNQLIVNLPVSEGNSVDQSTYLKEKEINDKYQNIS